MQAERMKQLYKQNSRSFAKQIGAGGAPKAIKADSVNITENGGSQDSFLTQISAKIQVGQELSSAELQYLKENYPDLYKEAMDQIKEAKAYEEELRQSKTKEEARMKHLGKISEAFSQAKSAEARGDVATCMKICAKVSRMAGVFSEFSASAEFSELADDAVELEERREAASTLPETDIEIEKPEPEENKEVDDDIDATKVPDTQDDQAKPEIAPAEAGRTPATSESGKPVLGEGVGEKTAAAADAEPLPVTKQAHPDASLPKNRVGRSDADAAQAHAKRKRLNRKV